MHAHGAACVRGHSHAPRVCAACSTSGALGEESSENFDIMDLAETVDALDEVLKNQVSGGRSARGRGRSWGDLLCSARKPRQVGWLKGGQAHGTWLRPARCRCVHEAAAAVCLPCCLRSTLPLQHAASPPPPQSKTPKLPPLQRVSLTGRGRSPPRARPSMTGGRRTSMRFTSMDGSRRARSPPTALAAAKNAKAGLGASNAAVFRGDGFRDVQMLKAEPLPKVNAAQELLNRRRTDARAGLLKKRGDVVWMKTESMVQRRSVGGEEKEEGGGEARRAGEGAAGGRRRSQGHRASLQFQFVDSPPEGAQPAGPRRPPPARESIEGLSGANGGKLPRNITFAAEDAAAQHAGSRLSQAGPPQGLPSLHAGGEGGKGVEARVADQLADLGPKLKALRKSPSMVMRQQVQQRTVRVRREKQSLLGYFVWLDIFAINQVGQRAWVGGAARAAPSGAGANLAREQRHYRTAHGCIQSTVQPAQLVRAASPGSLHACCWHAPPQAPCNPPRDRPSCCAAPSSSPTRHGPPRLPCRPRRASSRPLAARRSSWMRT